MWITWQQCIFMSVTKLRYAKSFPNGIFKFPPYTNFKILKEKKKKKIAVYSEQTKITIWILNLWLQAKCSQDVVFSYSFYYTTTVNHSLTYHNTESWKIELAGVISVKSVKTSDSLTWDVFSGSLVWRELEKSIGQYWFVKLILWNWAWAIRCTWWEICL